jgi:hypothetical protein
MKTMMLIAIANLLPLVSGVAEQSTQAQLPQVQLPNAPTLLTRTTGNWYFIATTYGPSIPPGWQLLRIEAVIQNGNTVSGWQVYLYNPATRQTAGWLVGIN